MIIVLWRLFYVGTRSSYNSKTIDTVSFFRLCFEPFTQFKIHYSRIILIAKCTKITRNNLEKTLVQLWQIYFFQKSSGKLCAFFQLKNVIYVF